MDSRTAFNSPCKTGIFGTPAPFEAKINSDKNKKKNKQRLACIQVFNETLKEQYRKSNISFADTYKLTSGKNGYNNNKWMIDEVHLLPGALRQLINLMEKATF